MSDSFTKEGGEGRRGGEGGGRGGGEGGEGGREGREVARLTPWMSAASDSRVINEALELRSSSNQAGSWRRMARNSNDLTFVVRLSPLTEKHRF